MNVLTDVICLVFTRCDFFDCCHFLAFREDEKYGCRDCCLIFGKDAEYDCLDYCQLSGILERTWHMITLIAVSCLVF